MKTNTPRPISGDYCHAKLTERIKPRLSFDPTLPFDDWKNKVREKLYELLGMEEMENNACALDLTIEQDEINSDYRLIRFVFDSETGEWCAAASESDEPCPLGQAIAEYPFLPDGTKYPTTGVKILTSASLFYEENIHRAYADPRFVICKSSKELKKKLMAL